MVENGCSNELRPTWCSHCEAETKFHRHGSYTRSLYTIEDVFEIRIFRFKCTTCAKTCSVLPSFLRSNHTAALDLQEHVIRNYSNGLALRTISEQLDPVQSFSEKTLWRWKNYWYEFLIKLRPVFWQMALARYPHLLLPRGGDAPDNNWGWVFWVWDRTRLRWTDKPIWCFQWLTSLAQPMAVAAYT